MEKEQIVKALEYCTNFTPSSCDNCPFVPKGDCYKGSMGCNNELMENALSLIREQEKRIEEIKSETARKMQERLKHECLADSGWEVFQLGAIDRIAKEILDGGENDVHR